ncbi:branched-chain amino acid ABC transporter permease [Meiothermus ruber]|uniref:Inner-membrane translocator n=1 Tax=Meiothermus ruber (strain ATCC 35948 / DSM 1279 / VKM B-1258 / 21) TaxID=504728 RepID=D3PN74_MEIRD|nr:branched-chain amino acid ABC transporter permease [Meiothermus ruber]GIW38737.1 MAG: branched-chain amino acid ABC transporter permease [Meiothermus sp.]ADD29401.1 inner-membrane translocator [Meiothermus ruber DSM 1279]AGK05150.1 inner-membrane translocator [Meiothermus ruber DSM 1279]MCL6530919.1 branched-chain amino acid ABC transporter permease [Meiothermus ruber]MCX7802133.1 branched-chain amino acid ABC transporter permease [Meiothermus ruber]
MTVADLFAILPQTLLEGLLLGFVYAMVALGYTMVYGVLGLINFAHSEVFMIGAVIGLEVFRFWGNPESPVIANPFVLLLVALIFAAVGSGIMAVLVERFAYRPLRKRGSKNILVPMITAIGVSFLLQDLTRIYAALRHNEFNMQYRTYDALNQTFELPFQTIIQVKGIIIIVVSILMLIGLTYLVNRTKLGKAIRAVSQDMQTASLMGINPDVIISRTFLIGGSLGGVAGVLFGLLYTNVTPYSGVLPGLKAFTSAVLGGIGNIPGAMVGGLILGQLETLSGTYLPFLTNGNFGTEYKDVFAFLTLVLLLLFRPQGIFGQNVSEKV